MSISGNRPFSYSYSDNKTTKAYVRNLRKKTQGHVGHCRRDQETLPGNKNIAPNIIHSVSKKPSRCSQQAYSSDGMAAVHH
ncbi:hypothetical protein AYI69_g5725 [Smittium culicis]|uniref:Uncharacterized protein n=1 Tax=Smittium culicis TaxID=133412 RepID=A0A1R1Y3X2_9FUNG|nr:hypothetical protein AYI69_g5725 [Smittium culicis]